VKWLVLALAIGCGGAPPEAPLLRLRDRGNVPAMRAHL